MERDTIPVRLPSGSKAIIDLPRPFTVADATHLVAFLTQYIEDEIHGAAPVTKCLRDMTEADFDEAHRVA